MRYLKHKADGYIYPWTPELASHPDLIPHDPEADELAVQQEGREQKAAAAAAFEEKAVAMDALADAQPTAPVKRKR